jgi:uncharacterized membrane protein
VSRYRDPRDKRVLVPKKGGGLVLNFAHPVAWWILASITVVPLIVVAGLLLAYLR